MKIAKLIIDYSKLSDANLNQRAQNVLDALTGNANFPITTPTLMAFNKTLSTYNTHLAKAANGDRELIALKNQTKLALTLAMRQLALDISTQANGDKAKLLSSGFDMGSTGEASAPLENPREFTISDGANPGELIFSCKGVKNVLSYIFQYSEEMPTADTPWKIQPNSSRQFTFVGLKSGARIYGRITAVGRRGQKAESDIISRVVQ
ncbi:hypothetical protein [Pedobacter boryungensis]|nr:hypothetical protein [Pedobacter boryungensis]